MKRALLYLAAAVSLVLCVLSAVLWIRSYRPGPSIGGADSISITHSDPTWWIISNRGRAILCRQVGKDWGNPLHGFHFLGIDFGGEWGPGSLLWNLAVPYWMIVVLMAILPTICIARWFGERHRHRSEALGLCSNCGYDLRASPQRCPECGKPTMQQGFDHA
ncbi:MAG TPA: hypothetical protein VH518_16195 [Tepidisphaeraceae bacterium]